MSAEVLAGRLSEAQAGIAAISPSFDKLRGLYEPIVALERQSYPIRRRLAELVRQQSRLSTRLRVFVDPTHGGQLAREKKDLEAELSSLQAQMTRLLPPEVQVRDLDASPYHSLWAAIHAAGRRLQDLQIQTNHISREIHRREREGEKQYAKERRRQTQQRMRARLASFEGRSRSVASAVRAQLSRYDRCPYCFEAMGSDPHADHIYPVSLGGLSTDQNMVYVCHRCNAYKRNLTLRQFIARRSLDRKAIERVLEQLGKVF